MGMRKTWKTEEKLAVVLSGLKGSGVRDICREYGISDGQYYKWREEALSGMKKAFADKRQKGNGENSWEGERNRLLKIIGEQQMIIDLQKKISKEF